MVEVFPTHFQQQLASKNFIEPDCPPLQRQCKVSLWPIYTGNSRNGHWTLISLDHATLELSLHDSDSQPNSTYHTERDGGIRIRAGSPAAWLLEIHGWIISRRSDFTGRLTVIDRSSNTPRQVAGTNDCGAYVALFLTCLADGQQPWTPFLDPEPPLSSSPHRQFRAPARAHAAPVDVPANMGNWRMRLALMLLDPNSTWGPGTQYPGYSQPPPRPIAAHWEALGIAYPFPTKAILCPALPPLAEVTTAYHRKSLQHHTDRTADMAEPDSGTRACPPSQRASAAYDAIKDWYERRERVVGALPDPDPRLCGAAFAPTTSAGEPKSPGPRLGRHKLAAAPPHHFAVALRATPKAHNHTPTPRWTKPLIPSAVWRGWCTQHSAAMMPAWPELDTPPPLPEGLTPYATPRRSQALGPRRRVASPTR